MSNQLSTESLNPKVSKHQLFFTVLKLVDAIGIENYSEIKLLLGIVLNEEQIKQAKKEETKLSNLVYKKINENPLNIINNDSFYGDSLTDLISGILSRGESFITKFLADDEETHKLVNTGIYNERFGYIIPYEKTLEISYNDFLPKCIEEVKNFSKLLHECDSLSDKYKSEMQESIDYIVSIANKILNETLDLNFDKKEYDNFVRNVKKKSRFAEPLMQNENSFGGTHNVFGHAWVNGVSDYIEYQSALKVSKNFNFYVVFKHFDSSYIKNHKDKNLSALIQTGVEARNDLSTKVSPLESQNNSTPKIL